MDINQLVSDIKSKLPGFLEKMEGNLKIAGVKREELKVDNSIDLYRSGICDSFDMLEIILHVEEKP